ncbi:MAG: hypothetical protein H6752_20515 [Candidatus Omnitrophica bacterium]|nr:hypothetical protein [Candidatus Omnitrophota bacterium]
MRFFLLSSIVLCISIPGWSADLIYKEDMIGLLVKEVPKILENYDSKTGRFGTGIWICRDQHDIYPLAVAYSTKHEDNPYFKDPQILEAIVRGGDALIEDADEDGKWIFRKKDGSEWGMIWMPWTYSRWVRAFDLVKEDMPQEARDRWEKALTLGYSGVKEHALNSVHNIPAHHAMGLYIAGKALNKPEWMEFASDFLMKVVEAQNPAGYWSENIGPVVAYNFVYADALGTYYAVSGDERVLPALERCAEYHLHFTYPDGTTVETIDERNPYHDTIRTGNVGFTFTPEGRAYLKRQWDVYGREKLGSDQYASLILYGEEGPIAQGSEDLGATYILNDGESDKALTYQQGPWFICLSAFTAPVPQNRWIQDRQNLVSVFHEQTGLLLGGGNTKLQPAWSNFTVGDASLLSHTPGDEDPDFLPKGDLYHVPSSATLVTEPPVGLDLEYGPADCSIRLEIVDDSTLDILLEMEEESALPVNAHLTFLLDLEEPLKLGTGEVINLNEDKGEWTDLGGSIVYRGAQLTLPKGSSLIWPTLPHNPYRKDGHANPEEGIVVVRVPLQVDSPSEKIRVEILED